MLLLPGSAGGVGESRWVRRGSAARPCQQVVQAAGLVTAHSVSTTAWERCNTSSHCACWEPGDSPRVADVGVGDRVTPPGLDLEGGEVLHLPTGGSDR